MSTRLIRVHEDTLNELSKHGKFGQSYNDVLKRVLENKSLQKEE